MIDIQRFWLYWWKETIKFDSLHIGSLGKDFILNRRNICSFFMNSRFLVHRYSNQLRIAFRTRARLVCHLVYYLYVRIESCHFVSRWTPERHIRNCSFKREMKISRLNLYRLFSDLSWEFSFVYRKPGKKAIFNVFCSFELSR